MGYCVQLVNDNFKINKKNANEALKALKNFVKGKEYLDWVDEEEVLNSEDIVEAFSAIRYKLDKDDNGDYILDYFSGENLGDDEDILNSVAKYVEKDSYLEFAGEDGDRFRLLFDGKKCTTKYPKMIWE